MRSVEEGSINICANQTDDRVMDRQRFSMSLRVQAAVVFFGSVGFFSNCPNPPLFIALLQFHLFGVGYFSPLLCYT